MMRTLVMMSILLALGSCGLPGLGGDADKGEAELDASRVHVQEVTPTVTEALLERLGGQASAVRAQYALCGGAPSHALSYKEHVTWSESVEPHHLKSAGYAMLVAGWQFESERPMKNGIASTTWTHHDYRVSLEVRRGELVWTVEGPCVRVSEEIGNELVGPVD